MSKFRTIEKEGAKEVLNQVESFLDNISAQRGKDLEEAKKIKNGEIEKNAFQKNQSKISEEMSSHSSQKTRPDQSRVGATDLMLSTRNKEQGDSKLSAFKFIQLLFSTRQVPQRLIFRILTIASFARLTWSLTAMRKSN